MLAVGHDAIDGRDQAARGLRGVEDFVGILVDRAARLTPRCLVTEHDDARPFVEGQGGDLLAQLAQLRRAAGRREGGVDQHDIIVVDQSFAALAPRRHGEDGEPVGS